MSDAIGLIGGAVRRMRGWPLRSGFAGLREGGRIRGIRLDSHLPSNLLIVFFEYGWNIVECLGRNRDCRSGGGFRVVLIGTLGFACEGISLARA